MCAGFMLGWFSVKWQKESSHFPKITCAKVILDFTTTTAYISQGRWIFPALKYICIKKTLMLRIKRFFFLTLKIVSVKCSIIVILMKLTAACYLQYLQFNNYNHNCNDGNNFNYLVPLKSFCIKSLQTALADKHKQDSNRKEGPRAKNKKKNISTNCTIVSLKNTNKGF